MPVHYQPDKYHSVTPSMMLPNLGELIDFMRSTFAAEVVERFTSPDGSIVHAEIKIGDSIIMMGEVAADKPQIPAALFVYVKDVDATYARALEAGATSIAKPEDQFWGDRTAGVKDKHGNSWWMGTHVEDLTREVIEKRAAEQMKR